MNDVKNIKNKAVVDFFDRLTAISILLPIASAIWKVFEEPQISALLNARLPVNADSARLILEGFPEAFRTERMASLVADLDAAVSRLREEARRLSVED